MAEILRIPQAETNYNPLKIGFVAAAGACTITLVALTTLSFLKISPLNHSAIGYGCTLGVLAGTGAIGGLSLYTYKSWQRFANPRALRACQQLIEINDSLPQEVKKRLEKPIADIFKSLLKIPKSKTNLFASTRSGEHHAFHSNLAKCLDEADFYSKSEDLLRTLRAQFIETPDGRSISLENEYGILNQQFYNRSFKILKISNIQQHGEIIAEIDRIWHASFTDVEIPEAPLTVREILLTEVEKVKSHLFVAVDIHNPLRLMGFMFVKEFENPQPNNPKLLIYSLARSPEAVSKMPPARNPQGRVHGVAYRLFEKFNEWAGNSSCALQVRETNSEAIRLYEEQGFSFVDYTNKRDFPTERVQYRIRPQRQNSQ